MGIFKVWQFLDSWGIINYQAGAGAGEDADGVPIKVQPAGDAQVTACAMSCHTEHWQQPQVRLTVFSADAADAA